jgi:GT2 family glycosyltransferase
MNGDGLPSVSVVVLNFNGLAHLPDCLSSLEALDYSPERLELVLVDNASSDGSVDFVQSRHPAFRVVQSERNLGFGGGNNLGAHEATGEWVVFLNNDMHAPPGLLHGFLAALRERPAADCLAAKILDWNGEKYDFAGAALHFAGYGYQLGYGEPVERARYDRVEPLLFACGGAMMVRREVFLDVGGFDGDFFAFYEDTDLGWRLWLLGHEVAFAPDAVVHHRHHGTTGALSRHRRDVLYKRNAIESAIKNYSDANLARALPAILLGTVAGLVHELAGARRLDLEAFGADEDGRAATARLTPPQAATLVALREVARRLPATFAKRRDIQERRRRTDEEIAWLFRRPFLLWPGVDSVTQSTVVETLGVAEAFARAPRRVLVVSPDILPYPGLPTVGSGLRAWGIAHGLRAAGHEVVLSMPSVAAAGREDLLPSEALELTWKPETLLDVCRRADPDVVVVCGWPVLDYLPAHLLDVPVALDQAGPHLLEREAQHAGDPAANAEAKLRAFAKADYFTSSGTVQHRYFEDWLRRAGWDDADLGTRAGVIPFSLDPALPKREPAAELTFVYGGIFLPWQDPSAALEELVSELERRGEGILRFFGGEHPWSRVEAPHFQQLVARLERSPHVVVSGFQPFDGIVDEYRRAHVAVDLMLRNRERELAFTTRTVVYLWCGLPVIYNDYSELSTLIDEYDAGWTVDPSDRTAIRAAIAETFEPEVRARKSANARRLVAERLVWDATIAPLDGYVRRATIRPTARRAQLAPPPSSPTLREKVRFVYEREGVAGVLRRSANPVRRRIRRLRAV